MSLKVTVYLNVKDNWKLFMNTIAFKIECTYNYNFYIQTQSTDNSEAISNKSWLSYGLHHISAHFKSPTSFSNISLWG